METKRRAKNRDRPGLHMMQSFVDRCVMAELPVGGANAKAKATAQGRAGEGDDPLFTKVATPSIFAKPEKPTLPRELLVGLQARHQANREKRSARELREKPRVDYRQVSSIIGEVERLLEGQPHTNHTIISSPASESVHELEGLCSVHDYEIHTQASHRHSQRSSKSRSRRVSGVDAGPAVPFNDGS